MKSRKSTKSWVTCLLYFFAELHQACTSQGHALGSSPGLPHSPQTSIPLADPYSPFTYTCIPYAAIRPPSAERKATAEVVPLKHGKRARRKGWEEKNAALGGG